MSMDIFVLSVGAILTI